MSKFAKLKEQLQKMLLEFVSASTDKGLLQIEGTDLNEAIDAPAFLIDEEGNETKPEDGNYVMDDGLTLVINDGKLVGVVQPEAPAEEPVVEEEPVEVENPEEVAEEPVEVEEPAEEEQPEEVVEQPVEVEEPTVEEAPEEVVEEPAEDKVAALEKENAELKAEIEALKAKIEELEGKPAAEPATEEYKKVNKIEKTGDKKLDRLAEILNA